MKKDKKIQKLKLKFNTEGKILEGATQQSNSQRKEDFEKLKNEIHQWVRGLGNENK